MPNTFGDAHLTMVKTYPGCSVAVTLNTVPAQTGYGFEFLRGSQVRTLVGDFSEVAEETSVLVKVGDFTGLKQGVTIDVDGTAVYEIRRVVDVDDAHLVRLVLADP